MTSLPGSDTPQGTPTAFEYMLARRLRSVCTVSPVVSCKEMPIPQPKIVSEIYAGDKYASKPAQQAENVAAQAAKAA